MRCVFYITLFDELFLRNFTKLSQNFVFGRDYIETLWTSFKFKNFLCKLPMPLFIHISSFGDRTFSHVYKYDLPIMC